MKYFLAYLGSSVKTTNVVEWSDRGNLLQFNLVFKYATDIPDVFTPKEKDAVFPRVNVRRMRLEWNIIEERRQIDLFG